MVADELPIGHDQPRFMVIDWLWAISPSVVRLPTARSYAFVPLSTAIVPDSFGALTKTP
jgi:hypothetical protein